MKAPQDESAGSIEAGFASTTRGTIGAEEELMLLHPETFELAPDVPSSVLSLVEGDSRFTEELPSSQIEIRTAPCRSVPELLDQLGESRRELAKRLGASHLLAGAGVHPLAPAQGELNPAPRYEPTRRQLGDEVLSRQLVFAFQVHVAPGDAASALAVYNAFRSYLPEIAGLAANAPFLEGKDTGLASVRPQISLLLPRQGMPPAIPSWEAFADALAWGKAGGLMPHSGSWWWELRPRPALGTLEVRVPDTQTTLGEAAAIAALVHALAVWLGDRHQAGEELPVHSSWRISENRWLAARDGVDAELADLDTGERKPLRERVMALAEELSGTATGLGCESELAQVEHLLRENGSARQRQVAEANGVAELPRWLAGRFLHGLGPVS